MEAKPTYGDVMEFVSKLRGNPYCKASIPGKSFEGRDIPMVEVTDARFPDDNKQLAVLAAGTHGSEEAGRAMAMAVIEWLASGQPYLTLRNQKIIVFPCVNPDGAVLNIYHNAQDINIYPSYGVSGEPATPEARVVWNALKDLNPALVAELHGLAGGGMSEDFYCHPGFHNSPVNWLEFVVAQEASDAAEAAGYPQGAPHREEIPGLPMRFCKLCNAFGYTLEVTENYYPLPQMIASGLVRLQALLAIGNRRNWRHYYTGYPCEAISGGGMVLLCAHGATAAERGANRRQLLAAVKDIPNMQRAPADRDHKAAVGIECARDLSELPRFSLQMRVHKAAKIKSVVYDGRELEPDDVNGYRIWEDTAAWNIRVNVNHAPAKGTHWAEARYEAQW